MKPKLWLLTGALLFLILISTAPALASTNNGATTEVQVGKPPSDGASSIIPYEQKMELNCTWSHGSVPGYATPFGWRDDNALYPLSGTGWANQIASITLPNGGMVQLFITDAFANGDYFEVYQVDGVSPTSAYLIGVTPIVPVGTANIVNPDAAFVSPVFSHAVFSLTLGPGTHYFAFREVGHNFGGGAFYIKFCASVGGVVAAEPNIVPFAALGFALFGIVGVVLVHKRMVKGKTELD